MRMKSLDGDVHHDDMMAIPNDPDRHAFVMLGSEHLFLSHLTMFHMENHCYQLILRAKLPPDVMQAYRLWRKNNAENTYFLGNIKSDLWTCPQVKIGARKSFIADIWEGIPHKAAYEEWPWEHQTPIAKSVNVTIEDIVYYRHFDFNHGFPNDLSYLLFGMKPEAFLVHFQTKEPDFDHVLSLVEAPDWLPAEQLQACVPIQFPKSANRLFCMNPLQNGKHLVRYAGFPLDGERLIVDILHSEWFCTKIVNLDLYCPDDGSCEAGPPAHEHHHASEQVHCK